MMMPDLMFFLAVSLQAKFFLKTLTAQVAGKCLEVFVFVTSFFLVPCGGGRWASRHLRMGPGTGEPVSQSPKGPKGCELFPRRFPDEYLV